MRPCKRFGVRPRSTHPRSPVEEARTTSRTVPLAVVAWRGRHARGPLRIREKDGGLERGKHCTRSRPLAEQAAPPACLATNDCQPVWTAPMGFGLPERLQRLVLSSLLLLLLLRGADASVVVMCVIVVVAAPTGAPLVVVVAGRRAVRIRPTLGVALRNRAPPETAPRRGPPSRTPPPCVEPPTPPYPPLPPTLNYVAPALAPGHLVIPARSCCV